MSGLVFVDDENNDVLDAWMNDTSGGFVKGSTIESAEPVTSKGGIGFVASSSANKKDLPSKKNVDKIASKKRGFQGDEDGEMHGVVDDVDESRTAIKSNQDKKADAEKKKAEIAQANQLKKAKIEKPNTFSGPPSQQHNKAPATSKANTQQGAGNNKNNGGNNNNNKDKDKDKQINTANASSGKPSKDHSKAQQNSAVTKSAPTVLTSTATTNNNSAAVAAAESTDAQAGEPRVNSRIRKRTKTRSKQKNIRRDNRADANKPIHLQKGSKEFHGRALTDATKVVLGMVSKK